MNNNLILLCSIAAAISIFLLILFIFSKQKTEQSIATGKRKTKDYQILYSHFFEKLYYAFFSNKNPVHIVKKLGLEYDKYMINCRVIEKNPNMEKECMMRIIGVFGFIISVILSCILWSFIPFACGIALYIGFALSIPKKAEAEAKDRKNKVVIQLSRFVDLLQSALDVGLPVDIALMETAEHVPSVISDDIKVAMAGTKISAMNWQEALEQIAHKYEISLFSDFVLDLITAHEKGVSISDAVARKSYEIKQSAILRAKERTAKMSTSILMPIAIFKLIPLLVIMMLPIIMEISRTFL